MKEQLKELLENQIIRPSTSPYGAPIIMVKKKEEGKYRLVCDFRKLNADTVKDKYPLPRIDDTIDALYGAKYITTLDLFSGFWQVSLDEESIHMTYT